MRAGCKICLEPLLGPRQHAIVRLPAGRARPELPGLRDDRSIASLDAHPPLGNFSQARSVILSWQAARAVSKACPERSRRGPALSDSKESTCLAPLWRSAPPRRLKLRHGI